MYLSNKSQLLKICNPTLYLISTLKKDAPILNFSEVVNSQAAVITAKTFNKLQMELLNLSTISLQDVHVLT